MQSFALALFGVLFAIPAYADVAVLNNTVDGYTYGVSDSTLPAGFWNGALCAKADYDEVGYQSQSTVDFELNQWIIPMEGVVSDASGTPIGYASFPVTAEFATHNGSEWRTWKSERTVPVPTWNGSAYVPYSVAFTIWTAVSGTAPLEVSPTAGAGDPWRIRFYPTAGWGTATTTSLLIGWGNDGYSPLTSGVPYLQVWRSRETIENSFCQVSSYANQPGGQIVYDIPTETEDAETVTSTIPVSTYDGRYSSLMPMVRIATTGTVAAGSFDQGVKTRLEAYTRLQDRFPICVAYPYLAFIETFQKWTMANQTGSAGIEIGGGIAGATTTLSLSAANDTAASIGFKIPAEFLIQWLVAAGWVLFAARVIWNQFMGEDDENE